MWLRDGVSESLKFFSDSPFDFQEIIESVVPKKKKKYIYIYIFINWLKHWIISVSLISKKTFAKQKKAYPFIKSYINLFVDITQTSFARSFIKLV